ncbi:MAG: transposase [Chloroflexota bacterium]|nr:transposase [Chloroflexota bacterium]
MLGPSKPCHLDKPVAVSLEELVPPDHFYRHLEAKLDLGFVREWARECYAQRGRPSIDPVVFFKLQLVMFFEGLRSERKLVETASLNLAHRWYLGYAVDESLPDHSSLTRIRQRLGVGIFERFLERVVDLCQGAGLVWGQELFFDATKVEANAAAWLSSPAAAAVPSSPGDDQAPTAPSARPAICPPGQSGLFQQAADCSVVAAEIGCGGVGEEQVQQFHQRHLTIAGAELGKREKDPDGAVGGEPLPALGEDSRGLLGLADVAQRAPESDVSARQVLPAQASAKACR